MGKLLAVRDLNVSFRSSEQIDTQILHDVSFSIAAGETLGLVGESGSGKSVSAMSILQLLPRPTASITSGSVVFDDQELLTLNEDQLRVLRGNDIGVIFQEPMSSLNPVQTIGRQLAEVFHLHRGDMSSQAIDEACLDLLEQVEIDQVSARLRQYPHELSGGMRQRVMIAMAIACKPKLLIADEPTTALDVTVQKGIMALLKTLQAELGLAVLLISHDLPLVRHYCDRVAVMHGGRLIETNDTEALFSAPQQEYTRSLLSAFSKATSADINHAAEEVVAVKNLSVTYPLRKGFWGQTKESLKAVNNLSFVVRRGETLGVVGESGSGKSSLIKALLRLENSEGKIYVNGQRFDQLSSRQLRDARKSIQVVLQDPLGSLSPRMTVRQILHEPLEIHTNLTRLEQQQAIDSILLEVGLDVAAQTRFPHEFSGGQRQRIAIARALITKPEVLVLDEPTSALDKTVQIQIIELLQALQRDKGLTYIFISHDLQVIDAISQHVLVIKQGEIVEQGETAHVLSRPKSEYTQALVAASFFS